MWVLRKKIVSRFYSYPFENVGTNKISNAENLICTVFRNTPTQKVGMNKCYKWGKGGKMGTFHIWFNVKIQII